MAPRPHPPGIDPTINHAEPEPVASPPLPPGLAPTTVQRGPGELPKVLDEGHQATPLVPANPAVPPSHLAGAYPFLSPTDRTEELGRLGPYRVVKLLGAGGMGFVFLAEDEGLLRPVALKVMRPEVAAEPTARERFLREGRAVANIRSDHVITIHQVGEANGAPFLAMEYLEGLTLDDWLKAWSTPRQRPVTATAVIRVAKDVLKGLVAAHTKGLIHRDIKPANLWVEAQTSRVKLLDFGLTRGGDSDQGLTRTGQILGTPAYMAPEQARGLPVDARADLFSVGVVLYRMLAGKNPFQRDSMFATLTSLAVDDPPPAASFGVVPAELATLIDRLMAKSPDRRPATAKEAFSVVLAIENQVRAARAAPSATVPKPKTSVAPQQTDVVTDVVEYWGEYRTGPRETPDRAEIDLEIEPEPPGLESGHNLRTGSRGSTSESNDQKTPRVPVAEATARPSITRSFTPLPSHPTPGSVGRPLPVSGPFPHVRPRALPPDGGLPRPSKWQTLPRLWLLALVAVVLLVVALVGLAIGLGGGAVIKRLRNAQTNCVEPGGDCVTTTRSDTRSWARIAS